MQHLLSKRAITSVICALVQDELSQLRAQAPRHNSQPLVTEHVVTEHAILALDSRPVESEWAIAIDSFEWMALATRVVNYFRLNSSGLEDYLLRKNALSDWAEIVLKSRELASHDLRLTTSGSTGKPKVIDHSYSALVAEVSFFIEYFEKLNIKPQRIVSVVPAHHIYGFLFTVLLPDLLSIPVMRGIGAHAKAQQGLQTGDLLVAFPSFLTQLAKRSIQFAPNVAVLTSTGPCPPATLAALKAEGAEQVVEIYGSTDTGGIGVRHHETSPYELLPRWQRARSSIIDRNSKQTVAIPDSLTWQPESSERYFLPQGRIDQAVSVHGINVFPTRVADILGQHPNVKEARVRLLPDGSGLKALIVPHTEPQQAQTLITELQQYAQAKLSAVEQPKHYQVASHIPVNKLGKETDWPMDP
ncbi:AMP-binding protein [Aliidiomarina celeris]|uniref:AMP-binding protein n=1 Tax=Aliidiomarina celeris TaxID=2249428 RepID=UPI000DE864E0|nr:AMP-binding protein [Aliidiomarina celeris]